MQIEKVGPTAVTLHAAEDGLFLRAVGPSIEDPNHSDLHGHAGLDADYPVGT